MGGVGGWVGGPCDYSVSPSPFSLDFGLWDLGLGLDNLRSAQHETEILNY